MWKRAQYTARAQYSQGGWGNQKGVQAAFWGQQYFVT